MHALCSLMSDTYCPIHTARQTRQDSLVCVVSGVKVKFSYTRYRALGPELIPVYRQSARR